MDERATLTLELPNAADGWTVDDLEQIADGGDLHVELDEGQLLIMPAAWHPWNSRITRRLQGYLEARGRSYLLEPGVRLPSGGRSPDLGVFYGRPEEVAYHRADEFAIVIEVVSASTAFVDYQVKPGKYAVGGVPEYWIVDRHPDDPEDALVKIHHLVRDDGGPVYRVARTIPLSKLEQEAVGLG